MTHRSREQIRAAIRSAAVVEIPALERRIGTIAAIADCLTRFSGYSNCGAQGIIPAEAANADSGEFGVLLAVLITSATGFAIAIMASLAHHFLAGRVRSLVRL